MLPNHQDRVALTLLDIVRFRIRNQLDTTAFLQSSILDAILNDSVRIFRGECGEIIGYVAWANIKRETLNYIYRTQTLPHYAYEWHEGKIKLFFDTALCNRWRFLARYYLFQFLRKHRLFAYYRKGRIRAYKGKFSRCNGLFWHFERLELPSNAIFKLPNVS